MCFLSNLPLKWTQLHRTITIIHSCGKNALCRGHYLWSSFFQCQDNSMSMGASSPMDFCSKIWHRSHDLCMSRKCHILKGILEQNMFYGSLVGMSSLMQLTEFKYNHWCYHFALFQINSLIVIFLLLSWPANCYHSWETFLSFSKHVSHFLSPPFKNV